MGQYSKRQGFITWKYFKVLQSKMFLQCILFYSTVSMTRVRHFFDLFYRILLFTYFNFILYLRSILWSSHICKQCLLITWFPLLQTADKIYNSHYKLCSLHTLRQKIKSCNSCVCIFINQPSSISSSFDFPSLLELPSYLDQHPSIHMWKETCGICFCVWLISLNLICMLQFCLFCSRL